MADYSSKIPNYCLSLLKVLNGVGHEAYIVGGAVRDLLLGIEPHDFDIATSALPDEVSAVCLANDIKVIPGLGRAHGTVVVVSDGHILEITTFRTEGQYSDSRRPDSVTFTRSIDEDVKRRDFTVNALYLDANGDVCDCVGGISDLKDGLLRAVGDPYQRFSEDALRILRGLRFCAAYGFRMDDDTRCACAECAPLLEKISSERIYTELTGLVCAPYASAVIRENLAAISYILPEVSAMEGLDQHSRYHDLDMLEHTLRVLDGIPLSDSGRRPVVTAYAALFHDIGKPEVFYIAPDGRGHMKRHSQAGARKVLDIAWRLKFPAEVRDRIYRLVLFHDVYVKPERKFVHRFMYRFPDVYAEDLFTLQKADILAHSDCGRGRLTVLERNYALWRELISEKAPYRVSDLVISGADLIAAGYTPGPDFGRLLRRALRAVVEGDAENNKDDLLDYLKIRIP